LTWINFTGGVILDCDYKVSLRKNDRQVTRNDYVFVLNGEDLLFVEQFFLFEMWVGMLRIKVFSSFGSLARD